VGNDDDLESLRVIARQCDGFTWGRLKLALHRSWQSRVICWHLRMCTVYREYKNWCCLCACNIVRVAMLLNREILSKSQSVSWRWM
jgi:hypothetical protein